MLSHARIRFATNKKDSIFKTYMFKLGNEEMGNETLKRGSLISSFVFKRPDKSKSTSSPQLKAQQGQHPNDNPITGSIFTEDQYKAGLSGGGIGDKCSRTEGVLGETTAQVIERNQFTKDFTPDWKMSTGPVPWFGMHVNDHRKYGGGFGHPWDTMPAFLTNGGKSFELGVDRIDWFFRLFNKSRIYENLLKSTPTYFTFIVWIAISGCYFWDRWAERFWLWNNKGKFYFEHPYVYPPEEEE